MSDFVVNHYCTLTNVHKKADCVPPCVIHYPTDHHMKDWRLHWRDDKRAFERICKHGVGHPDPDDPKSVGSGAIHGCDGCCQGGDHD